MNPRINTLVESLFQKDGLEQCSLQELQQLAARHPYFSAAHLLLAKKLQSTDAISYAGQLQTTSLFFDNILWMEHLLNDTGDATVLPAAAPDSETTNPG